MEEYNIMDRNAKKRQNLKDSQRQEAEKARMKRNRQNFWDIKRIIGNAELGSGSIHEAGYGEALALIKKVIEKDKDWDMYHRIDPKI